MKRIWLVGLLALVGCGGVQRNASYGSINGWSANVGTVEHEGHKFVVARCADGISIIHHPGCDCLKGGIDANR